jgi:AcrR family transcriptional regulator
MPYRVPGSFPRDRSLTAQQKTPRKKSRHPADPAESSVRNRILGAAFAAFMEHGYSGASTLEIATRAKVSKRELYALVGSKQDMLIACIAKRSTRMRWAPAEPVIVRDRDSLAQVLEEFGARLLGEVSHPTVVATFRLAIAEAKRAPQVARTLDVQGRQVNRAPLTEILNQASAAGLLRGAAAEMAEQFLALLWGGLFTALLLGIAQRPEPTELARRARSAASALLRLYAQK